jgi:hypothetical protein
LRISDFFRGARSVAIRLLYDVAYSSESKLGDTTGAMEKKVLVPKKTAPAVQGNATKSKLGTVKPEPKVITAMRILN